MFVAIALLARVALVVMGWESGDVFESVAVIVGKLAGVS